MVRKNKNYSRWFESGVHRDGITRFVRISFCNNKTVVNILADRNATQRALIQQEYKTMYAEDLDQRLSSELSGDLKGAVLLWMHDPVRRDATVVRQALRGTIVNLRIATEVLCSSTPSQIQQLKAVYHAMFGVYVEHDIERQASGDHKKLMVAYVVAPRHEGPEVDRMMVETDAEALFKAGEKWLGTDEKTFIRIFSERSKAHLATVKSAYRSMYGKPLAKVVKKKTSGNFKFALLTILRCAVNPGKYFAKALHKAMKGLGTDETTLSRIIVTRAEIDMQDIKAEYFKKYGETLHGAVHSATFGVEGEFLLTLLGPKY
ncbi:annexin D5-like isoform X2 [Actinidia eriantha]|uniref:annexin D5-like isoform X2 n=1 Tax=Actinidia eriantha TaxID=165200 RepID=UPI0025827C80|nr:annexin D5-like isoform X2 [Actinidia eriantha]